VQRRSSSRPLPSPAEANPEESFPATTAAQGTSTGKRGLEQQHRGQTTRFFEAGVGFTSYEIDFFGKIRSLNHEALERYLSSEETRRSTQLSLIPRL